MENIVAIDVEKIYNEILPTIEEDLKGYNRKDKISINNYYNICLNYMIQDYLLDNYIIDEIKNKLIELLTN